MSEEKKEIKEEQPTEDTGEGDIPESVKRIDDANLASKRLEAANKKQEELQIRAEELEARRILGGRSEAGQVAEKSFTDEEKASRKRIKDIGNVQGSGWAKNYE